MSTHAANLVLAPAAVLGMPLSAVDTPALILELDAFERNLDRMQALTASAGVALRPHAKAHKTPAIALAQLQRGAIGICCQKVSEALPFVQAGVADIHISNQIAGPAKAAMLATLAGHARFSVCVDHPLQLQWLAEATAEQGSRLDVLIEIDIGQQRCGVRDPAAALSLLDALACHGQLRFRGLQAYHGGLQHIRNRAERRDAAQRAAARTAGFIDALAQAGQDCPVVTGGGTGSVEFDCDSGIYTEVQPGSYVFMDGDYNRNEQAEARRFEQSLWLACTVMSVGAGGRSIVDAGLKSVAVDSGLPRVWPLSDKPAFEYLAANDEHGIVQQLDPARPPVGLGTQMLLVPGHCDPTLNLHDQIVGVRAQSAAGARQVACLWPVSARGLSR